MRVRRLPEVFAARGSAPLPPAQRRRPRPTLALLALGVFVLLTAGAGLCSGGYGLYAAWLVVHGPRDGIPGAVVTSALTGVLAMLAPRGRLRLLRRWMAEEDVRRPPPGT